MQAMRKGHLYLLDSLEGKNPQWLQFIEKMPSAIDRNMLRTVKDGTTNEEVLRVLIDRMETLYKKLPSKETKAAIRKAKECLTLLEKRTAKRMAQNIEGTALVSAPKKESLKKFFRKIASSK